MGAGAGKFLGVRKILAQNFPNLPKKTPKNVPPNTGKKSSCDLVAILFKSKHDGRHFCSYFQGVCGDFQGFCEGFHIFCPDFHDFVRILRDFSRIFTKSKLLGVHLHPRLLHHWSKGCASWRNCLENIILSC